MNQQIFTFFLILNYNDNSRININDLKLLTISFVGLISYVKGQNWAFIFYIFPYMLDGE